MEKTLFEIIKTDTGVETHAHYGGNTERMGIAMSIAALMYNDFSLSAMILAAVENIRSNPAEIDKKIITVKGGVPWDNNQNK